MDVDTSYNVDPSPQVAHLTFSPVPLSAAPTITGFNQLFYDTQSPRRSYESPVGPLPKKRRSLSPESVRRTTLGHHVESSSPMLHSSPSEAKLERIASGTVGAAASNRAKPSLQGLGAPSANFLKRPRRPVLSAVVPPSDAHHIQSAYPILSPPASGDDTHRLEDDPSPRGSAPVRRAFSAFLPPSIYTAPDIEGADDSSESFDVDGPDMSSPAQAYSRRQQVKTIRRCDGTEDFRPLTGATALTMRDSQRERGMTISNGAVTGLGDSPSAKFMVAHGLPGFGDNEAHGKILPCHRVTEDGLMRIKPQTVGLFLFLRLLSEDCVVDFILLSFLPLCACFAWITARRPAGWQIQ